MDLSATNRGFKNHWRPSKESTVSKTICVYIVANLVTELSTINSPGLPRELISYPKLLHPPHHHRHNSRLKPPSNQSKKSIILAFSRLQGPSRLFIFAFTLTPANSVEISDKHFVSRCTIKINGKFENPTTLFDTGVTGETIMDRSYAFQHIILFISLIKVIFLQGFDGNFTGSRPVTHFVNVFSPPLAAFHNSHACSLPIFLNFL